MIMTAQWRCFVGKGCAHDQVMPSKTKYVFQNFTDCLTGMMCQEQKWPSCFLHVTDDSLNLHDQVCGLISAFADHQFTCTCNLNFNRVANVFDRSVSLSHLLSSPLTDTDIAKHSLFSLSLSLFHSLTLWYCHWRKDCPICKYVHANMYACIIVSMTLTCPKSGRDHLKLLKFTNSYEGSCHFPPLIFFWFI